MSTQKQPMPKRMTANMPDYERLIAIYKALSDSDWDTFMLGLKARRGDLAAIEEYFLDWEEEIEMMKDTASLERIQKAYDYYTKKGFIPNGRK